jgi:hypothetical protein
MKNDQEAFDLETLETEPDCDRDVPQIMKKAAIKFADNGEV